MSLSNPRQSTNPATKFINFAGDKGEWYYYDKETEKNVTLELPAYFIILDELSTITGYSKSLKSFIYSNEIHTFDERLTVKSFKGGLNIVGIYQDIVLEVKNAGGKYCKSVYAMMFDSEQNTELVNIKFSGSAISPFINAKIKIDKQILGLGKEMKAEKSGNVDFFVPEILTFKMDEKLLQKAIELDKDLQEYLQQYKKIKVHESVEQAATTSEIETVKQPDNVVPLEEYQEEQPKQEEDDLPF